MTQPDEITLTPEGKEGELLSYISDLKKEKQQLYADVKLLRAELERCSRTRSIGWPMDEKTCEALAATDRPEYTEEG